MLTIHHPGLSQTAPNAWFCEELELPDGLAHHARDVTTRRSPTERKALHLLGAAR